MSQSGPPRKSVIVGIMRIARGRADGIDFFGASAQSYLSSLAPLVAFPLVGAVMAIYSDGPRQALTDLAMMLCALLTPAVVSYELARIWKRDDAWLRFATVFNWCEWILPILACLLVVPLSLGIVLGLNESTAGSLWVGCLGLYGIWLHWFLARNALALSGFRAAMLVLVVNFGTILTVMGPRFLADRLG
jgi:hypothetical protein